MRSILALAAAVPLLPLLAACGSASSPAPAPTSSATGNLADRMSSINSPQGTGAKVAALPPGQRAGVLLRAVRDAGYDCQQVTASSRVANVQGPPTWLATCDGGKKWVVVVADDGTATVVDPKDLPQHR